MMKDLIKGRREFIATASVTTLGSLAALTFSGLPRALANAAQAKTKSDSLVIQNESALKSLTALQQAADLCTKKGEICHDHCQKQIAAGSTDFKDCDIAVQQMMVFSQAVSKLAALKSVRLKETLAPAIAAAQACKEACEAHKGHGSHGDHGMHTECKECAEACDQFIAAGKAFKV